jgi:hypothetical protein
MLAPTSSWFLDPQRHKSLWFRCAHVVQLRFFIWQNDFLEEEVMDARNSA